jgi:hypothetical protein
LEKLANSFPFFGSLTNRNLNVISKTYRFSSRHERSMQNMLTAELQQQQQQQQQQQ